MVADALGDLPSQVEPRFPWLAETGNPADGLCLAQLSAFVQAQAARDERSQTSYSTAIAATSGGWRSTRFDRSHLRPPGCSSCAASFAPEPISLSLLYPGDQMILSALRVFDPQLRERRMLGPS